MIGFNPSDARAIPSIGLKSHGLRSHRQLSEFLTSSVRLERGSRQKAFLPELSSPFRGLQTKGQPTGGKPKKEK